MNIEVMKTMSQGAQALKKGLQDVGGPDKIHGIVNNLSEKVEASNEISDSLSSPIECDLDDEGALIKKVEELADTPSPLEENPLPDPPTLDPKSNLDESLAQLSQWTTREALISS